MPSTDSRLSNTKTKRYTSSTAGIQKRVLLVTLAAEFLGLQKTIELAHACHAKVVSLILWDPKNERTIPSGGHWPRAYRTILPEQAVMEFQASDMDLIYMRNPQDEDGNRLIRLDFQTMYA